MFTEADIIHRYTRKQAIEDGTLVQLSGPGYEGDAWVPEMVAELGFRYPVAITAAAFAQYVDLTPAAEHACNDIQGRLWDVLYMLRYAITKSDGSTSELRFEFYCVVNKPIPELVELKSVCGPGDDAEPVLTIMLPEED